MEAGLWGVWVIEKVVFWFSPLLLLGGKGVLSVFGRWLRRVRCGWRLRPELLPVIGSSLGWMRGWFPLFCPSAFWSLWARNQVTGLREG